jgi:hypothetical protein
MERRIVFSLLLGTFSDASLQMRPTLLRRLDTSTQQEVLPGPMFRQTQHDALYAFFRATEMDSEASRPLHNWFDEVAGFPALHYCNFTGVGCDEDLFVSTLDLNGTMLAGEIPNTIGDLSRLLRFRVVNNTIGGLIPQSLAQISGLRNLHLGHNSLSGTLPDFSASSLRILIIDRNSLTGMVPETLCHLRELSVLDLSGSTKLIGSLPSCLGDLTFLSQLRIRDSGLTGSVPAKLCNERVMNGLSPNTFGCDAVGCAAGSFQPKGGRQRSSDTACETCDVPSNVIGASVCQWYEPLPRRAPSSPFPSSSVSLAPSASPSPKPRDSVVGIVQPSGAQGSPQATGIISGCIVLAAVCVALGAAVLWKARSRRPLMRTDEKGKQGQRPIDDKKSDASESLSFVLSPVASDTSETPTATFLRRFYLEGDDMTHEEKSMVNRNGRASILKTPMLASRAATPFPSRRVRFRLPPEPLSWSSDSDEESTIMIKDSQKPPPLNKDDAEAWASWIMNPVFVGACSPLSCTQPVREETDEELDFPPSADSSFNSMSPILPQAENISSDFYFGGPGTASQVVSPGNEPTIGIQDRNRGDDSDDAVVLEIDAAPVTKISQDRGVLCESSIAPQVSADDDDESTGLGPGMAEI